MVKKYILFIVLLSIVPVSQSGADVVSERADIPVPTHADAAVILAKHSGLFERYVVPDANLSDCVAFLNKQGVYFGLMEVVNGSEFTEKDCARVMGQIELLFTGEAEFLTGKVILPKKFASWEEFCIMHGVDYVAGYQTIVDTLRIAYQLND